MKLSRGAAGQLAQPPGRCPACLATARLLDAAARSLRDQADPFSVEATAALLAFAAQQILEAE